MGTDRNISLEKQLSRSFAGVYLSVFFVAMIFLFISIFNYREEKLEFYMDTVEGYEEKLKTDIQQINNIVSQIYLENTAFAKLPYEEDELEEYKLSYQLLHDIQLLLAINQGIEGIFIYYNNGNDVVYQMSNPITLEERNELFDHNDSFLNTKVNGQGYAVQEIGGEKYYNRYYVQDGVAVMGLININETITDLEESEEWANNVKGVLVGQDIVLSIGNDSVLEQFNFGLVEEGHSEIGSSIVYLKTAENTDLRIFCIVPFSVWNYITQQQLIILVLLLLSIYPALKLYALLKRQILLPLTQLIEIMRKIQDGRWDTEFEIDTNFEEINSVKKALEVMVKEIEGLKIEAYEEKSMKQYAELQHLQLQLSPHFYINCLKLIQAKIQLGQVENMDDFLIQLSAHFRYLMQQAMKLTSVKEEMQFVNNYVALAKEMSVDKLKTCIYVDQEARGQRIPMLAIQTFVENSIKYARATADNSLMISIYVKYMQVGEGDFVNITIKDDGVGFLESMLSKLNDAEVDSEEIGVGISNLKKRIRLIYRSDYSWYFYNQGGAVSELLLPCYKN